MRGTQAKNIRQMSSPAAPSVLLSREEYKAKHEELQALARAVDLWKTTPQSAVQKKKTQAILERLQAETFAHECSFLEIKLEIFTDLLAVLKNEK